jgi:predicted nucleic acid-binding Zn ribbon protein
MRNHELDSSGPDAHGLEIPGPETRTTASAGHSDRPRCLRCGQPVQGRRRNGYCSDRCRMAVRRERERARVDELLRRLEGDLDALREELVSVGEVEP